MNSKAQRAFGKNSFMANLPFCCLFLTISTTLGKDTKPILICKLLVTKRRES